MAFPTSLTSEDIILKRLGLVTTLLLNVFVQAHNTCLANDWMQFRGSDASAVSLDTKLPESWSESENLKWKVALPGAGSSSPVVVGDRVFVTCYSGYGVPGANGGDINSLERHLVCVNRADGTIRWRKTVVGELPEDRYQGYISEHGYASNTPVTDGKSIYCFYGKSGVVAYDLDGQQLWKTGVGKESSNRAWGSGSSLILYKDTVVVNASEEGRSVIGLDKSTGKQLWRAEGSAMELAYGTPALVRVSDERTDLVLAVPGEVWGLNPDTGKLQWFAEHQLTGNICPSIVADGDKVFVFGGFRSAGSLALRAGGEKDVTQSHTLWTSRNSSYVATPVLYEGHLYWINDSGQAFCVLAENGELVYRERVAEIKSGGRPVYASPVVANGKIYVQTRWNGMIVLPAKPEYAVEEQNQFASDESDFNATPAICDNELFLRSNLNLYCVAKRGN